MLLQLNKFKNYSELCLQFCNSYLWRIQPEHTHTHCADGYFQRWCCLYITFAEGSGPRLVIVSFDIIVCHRRGSNEPVIWLIKRSQVPEWFDISSVIPRRSFGKHDALLIVLLLLEKMYRLYLNWNLVNFYFIRIFSRLPDSVNLKQNISDKSITKRI